MKVILFVLTLCLLGNVMGDYAYSSTVSTTLTPTSDTLYITSAADIYNNYEIVWDESLTGNVEASIVVQSNSASDFAAFQAVLANSADGVTLTLQQTAATTGPTVAPTSAPTTVAPTDAPTVAPTDPPGKTAGNSASTHAPSFALLALASFFVFPKNRFSIALLLVAVVLAMSASADSTSSTKITLHIKVPTTMTKFCVGTADCFTRDSGSVSTYFSLFGYRYADLNSVYDGKCNTTRFMTIPDGWNIADETDVAFLVVYYNVLPYTSVAFSSQKTYTAGQWKVSDGSLTAYETHDSNSRIVSINCDRSLLIVQNKTFPIPESAHQVVGYPFISNYITFNGYDYATADNAAFSTSVASAGKFNIYVDSSAEWTIAPEEAASLVAIQWNVTAWGADAIVLASNNSFKNDLTAGPANALKQFSYNSGIIYSIDASVGNDKILIRRNSTATTSSWTTEAAITNTILYNGVLYATLDNWAATGGDATEKCQGHFMSLPSNWTLATSTEMQAFITAKTYGAFSPSYCFAADGLAFGPDLANCSATLLHESVGGKDYYTTKTCGRIIIKSSVTQKTSFTIGLKVLLLSGTNNATADTQIAAATTMFNATGTLFDWVYLTDSSHASVYSGDLPLTDASGNPKYYAIVLTDNQLFGPTGAVAITTAQLNQLTEYKYQYNVRLVSLNSYPTSSMSGLTILTQGATGTANTFLGLDTSFVAANPTLVGGLVSNATFNMSTVYYNTITVTSSSTVTPFLRIVAGSSAIPTTVDPVAGVVLTNGDATQEMHFFVPQSAYFTFGPILSNMWFQWVTKGLWMGNRRVYFVPQVDDLLLDTEQFDNYNHTNRMSGDDLRKTLTFLRSEFGANMSLEFGINGVGAEFVGGVVDDDLYDAIRELVYEFYWETHTYTHMDFTCVQDESTDSVTNHSNCEQGHLTSYSDCNTELTENTKFFNNFLFKEYGGINTSTFSTHTMITPAITGLFNPSALQAIWDNQIYCVVGDNSVAALLPANPYHGLLTTNETNGFDGMFIVPRQATEVYYDVSSVESEVIEYNTRYGISGTILAEGYNKTLEQIMVFDAGNAVTKLTLFRHDPYMFHQGNLVHWNYTRPGETEREWSLLTMWMKYVKDMYSEVMTFPILNSNHPGLWEMLQERMDFDSCGLTPTATVTSNVITSVTLASTGSCTAPITGLTASSCTSGSCVHETYGPDDTVYASLAAGGSVSLAASIAW